MDYELIESSGSIIGGNVRSSISSAPYQRMYVDMEVQIHNLEQEAYGAILRAFKAQSDALTWEKESLITELRKELRVSDDEHRDLLTKVNADNLIHRIREWRKTMGNQSVHDQLPSPTVSGSRKRPKMSQSVIMPLGAPLESLHHQTIAASTQPTTPGAKWGAAPGNGGFRSRPGQQVFSSSKPIHYQQAGPGSSSALHSGELAERPRDPLIGRRVMTRWPDDNNFYEAIITDYSAVDDRHALVYDINTPNETWEWVDLKEIRSMDIRWIGDDPGISRLGGGAGPGYGGVDTLSAGRGRRFARQQFENNVNASENRIVQKTSDEIEILHTETLLKKVEKVIDASHPDLVELEKAKKMLKEHEQALIDVIAKLVDACDSGSGGELPFFRKNDMLGSNHDGVDMEPEMRERGQGALGNHPDEDIRSMDIRWIGDDPGISRLGGGAGPGYGGVDTLSAGRGRRFARQQFENNVNASENRIVQKTSDEIEILHTETLLKKVEKVIDASHPDLVELEKAKKMLKEHEQALIDVIAKLVDACDSGSGGELPFFRKNDMLGSNHDGVDMEPEMRERGQGALGNHPDEDVIVI